MTAKELQTKLVNIIIENPKKSCEIKCRGKSLTGCYYSDEDDSIQLVFDDIMDDYLIENPPGCWQK